MPENVVFGTGPLELAVAGRLMSSGQRVRLVNRSGKADAPKGMTSNRGFADWDQVFHEAVAATAIVDRLIHNAVVLNVRGRSYRMKDLQATATGENGS